MRDGEKKQDQEVIKPDEHNKAKLERIRSRVTSRKKVEQEPQFSGDGFESIFDAISDWVAITNLKGRILRTNRSGENFTGLSSAEMVGKLCCELVHGSKKHILRCPLEEMIRTGQRASAELQLPDSRCLVVTVDPITDEEDNIRTAVHIVRDVTQHKSVERALKIKEAAIATSINAIAMTDLDGNLTYVNDVFLKMWGHEDVGEVLSRPANQFWQVSEWIEGGKKALHHGEGWIDEVPARHRDGSLFTVQLSTSIVLDQLDKLCCIMTSFIDITECKKAEKMLRESEERFKGIFENTLVGLYRTTPDGQILMANPALIRMLGYISFKELAKRDLEDGGFEPDYPRSQFKQLIETEGQIVGLESAWYKKDGTVLFVRESARAIRDDDGNTLYYEGTVEDITESKKTQEELRREHNLLRLLIDNIPDRIYLKDRKHRFILGNDTIVKYEGFQNEKDLLGKTDFDLYPEESAEQFYAEEEEIIQKCQPLVNHEELFENKQGNEQWTSTTKLPLQDGSRNTIGILGIHHDITERKRLEENLEKERQEFRLIVDSSPIIIFYKDLKGRFVRVNKAFAKALEIPEEEFIGKTVFDLYSTEISQSMANDDQEVLETGRPKLNIMERYKSASSIRWVRTDKIPIFDKDGIPVGLIGFSQDITERKLAEEEMQKQKELLDNILTASSVGLAYTVDRKIIWANPAMEELFGLSKEQYQGQDTRILYPTEEEYHRVGGVVYEQISKGKTVQLDGEFARSDGSVFHGHIKANFFDSNDHWKGMIVSIIDITERKKAEEALKESEKRYRATFEQSIDSIVLLDPETGQILAFNDNAYQNLGYSREEFEGLNLGDIEVNESLEEVINHMEKVAREGIDTFETKQRTKDGRIRDVLVSAKIISISGHDVCQGIWRDISERKQAEKSLLEYHEKLKSLASQLTLTEERERHRIATKLHDQISQSLAISKIKIEELLHSDILDDSRNILRDVSDWIGKAVTDTRLLTSDLSSPILYELGFEKAVAAWLDEEIQGKYNIATKFQDDGKPKPLDNDICVLLFRDIRELLINVVKHANAHEVTVSIKKMDSMIQVRVEDDGVGFNPTEATAAKMGAFGLFSVRERLEYLGGRFEIDSAPGCGCRITMLAPLKEAKTMGGDKK